MSTPDALAREIAEALDNALEGGYTELLASAPEIIALDLINYCADMENKSVEELLPGVRAWKEKQK